MTEVFLQRLSHVQRGQAHFRSVTFHGKADQWMRGIEDIFRNTLYRSIAYRRGLAPCAVIYPSCRQPDHNHISAFYCCSHQWFPIMFSFLELTSVLFLLVRVSYQDQKDPLNDFCRRFGHAPAVIDKRLFIDGGLLNWNPISQNPNNFTCME
jgi:hypothetical protein